MFIIMAYQDDVPSGPTDRGLEIDSDNDNDPKKPVAGLTSESGPTQAHATPAITPTPKFGLGT